MTKSDQPRCPLQNRSDVSPISRSVDYLIWLGAGGTFKGKAGATTLDLLVGATEYHASNLIFLLERQNGGYRGEECIFKGDHRVGVIQLRKSDHPIRCGSSWR